MLFETFMELTAKDYRLIEHSEEARWCLSQLDREERTRRMLLKYQAKNKPFQSLVGLWITHEDLMFQQPEVVISIWLESKGLSRGNSRNATHTLWTIMWNGINQPQFPNVQEPFSYTLEGGYFSPASARKHLRLLAKCGLITLSDTHLRFVEETTSELANWAWSHMLRHAEESIKDLEKQLKRAIG